MAVEAHARAAHLIAVITADGDTFPADAARELIGLVPPDRRTRLPFGIDVHAAGAGGAFEGAAAGGGSVLADGDRWERSWSANAPPVWACGWYRIRHRPGRLEIFQRFEGTFEDETGRACRLRYDRRSGAPLALDLRVQSALVVGPLRLAVSRYRAWKRPG